MFEPLKGTSHTQHKFICRCEEKNLRYYSYISVKKLSYLGREPVLSCPKWVKSTAWKAADAKGYHNPCGGMKRPKNVTSLITLSDGDRWESCSLLSRGLGHNSEEFYLFYAPESAGRKVSFVPISTPPLWRLAFDRPSGINIWGRR